MSSSKKSSSKKVSEKSLLLKNEFFTCMDNRIVITIISYVRPKNKSVEIQKRKLSWCNLKLVDKEKSLCEMNVLFRHLSLEKILYVYV